MSRAHRTVAVVAFANKLARMGVELAALGRTLAARSPIVRLARAVHPDDRRGIADPEPSAAPRADIPDSGCWGANRVAATTEGLMARA